jgi:hypothetical protein
MAQARVQQQVKTAEGDGDVEQPEPPARQRVVEFGQVVIPDMAGVFDFSIS